jgi:protein gp37
MAYLPGAHQTLGEAFRACGLEWPDNVWMGVSVETAAYVHRVDHLRSVPANVRFISFEPLLGSVGRINLTGIEWYIAGGESGPGARPIKEAGVTEIRDQYLTAGVPFFFKQWGGTNKKKTGRQLENRTWSELPYHNASHSLRESIKKDIMHRQCITVSSMVNSHEGQDKI